MHHRPHGDHACASCKHQRKKCKEDCTMAPFFPVQNNKQFRAVHTIFGVSNVAKQLKKHNREEHRRMSADSLVWEASCWENDPVQGPYGVYQRALEELNHYKTQCYRLAANSQGSAMNLAYNPRPTSANSQGSAMNLAYNPRPTSAAANGVVVMNGWNHTSPPTNINGCSLLSSVTHEYEKGSMQYPYTNNNGVGQDLDLEHIATLPAPSCLEQEIQRIDHHFQGQRDCPTGVITGIINGVIMPQRQLQHHHHSVANFQQLFSTTGQYHATSEGNPAGNIAGDMDSSGWTGNSQ